MKIDREEEITLSNIVDVYGANDECEFTVSVRPWIFEDYAKKPNINLITQFSLFKCMESHCIYATDETEHWNAHMETHLKVIEIFKRRGILNKQNRDELKRFRECSYCDYESKGNGAVIRHMEDHMQSIFQCAHCYYRSNEMDNMVIHYDTIHPNKDREILLLDEKREFDQTMEEILLKPEHYEQYVKKIQCGQGKENR